MAGPYNYDTFERSMLQEDMHFPGGPEPGQPAVAFELPTVDGGGFRLKNYLGQKPVLIESGSITCPMTLGARPGLHRLYEKYKDRLQFVSIYSREAHPGEVYSHHTSDEQKAR